MKNDSIRKGVGVIALAKYSNVFFTLLANAVLARLLSAEDYGIVAIVTVFVTFFQLIADMGLGTGVIQNRKLDEDDILNIFTTTLYISIGLMLLMVVLSFGIAVVYGNSVYIPVCMLLSISVFFYTFNMIPNAVLMRDKKFSIVGIRTVVVSMSSYVLAIIFAFLGFKYYALVIQAISNSVITFIWNYSTTKIKLKLRFSTKSVKKIISYSGYDFGFNLISYFARNSDNLLVGKVMGSGSLGYYGKAYNLMLYPVSYLTGVISPVLHPIFADYQDNKEYIYKQYMRVFKVLSLIGVFISTYCFFTASEIVLILYGESWEPVIPYIMALSTSIWFQMTSSSCGSIYKSIGHTDLMFKSAIRYVPIQLIFIVLGVISRNLIMLSWFVAVSFIFKFIIEYYYLVHCGFGVSVLNFYKSLVPEFIIAVVTVIVMVVTGHWNVNNIWLSAFVKGVICLIGYIPPFLLTKQHKYFLSFIKK